MPDGTSMDENTKHLTKLLVAGVMIFLVWYSTFLLKTSFSNKYMSALLFALIAFFGPLLEAQLHQKVENFKGMLNFLNLLKLFLLWIMLQTDSTNFHVAILVGLIVLQLLPSLMQLMGWSPKTLFDQLHHSGATNYQGAMFMAIIADSALFASITYLPHPVIRYVFLGVATLFMLRYVGKAALVGLAFAFFLPFGGWTLFWVLYRMLGPKADDEGDHPGVMFAAPSGGFHWGWVLIFLFVIGIVLLYFAPQIFASQDDLFVQARKAYQKTIDLPKFILEWFDRQLQRSVKAAGGDYYVGQVDENENKRLGVFLEEITASQSSFYLDDDDPVLIFGVIAAESLEAEDCRVYDRNSALQPTGELLYGSKADCEKEQTINLLCGYKDKRITGEVVPTSVNIYDVDGTSEGFDCTIDKARLTKELASEAIEVKAQFPFSTKAYYKTYFMDDQRKKDLRRASIDPLGYYDIKEEAGEQRYTNGPVSIGIGVKQDLPIAVKDGTSTRLGITIENRWQEGKVHEIRDLCIIPPAGVDMACPGFEKVTGADVQKRCGTTNTLSRAYLLKEKLKKQLLGEIETSQTYPCRITPDQSIVQGNPIVSKFFKVTFRYVYEISEETFARLKPGDGVISGPLGTCTEFCKDEDGCFCPDDDCKDLDIQVEQNANCNGDIKSELATPFAFNDTINQEVCIHYNSCRDYDIATTSDSIYGDLVRAYPFMTSAQDQRDLARKLCDEDVCMLGCNWQDDSCQQSATGSGFESVTLSGSRDHTITLTQINAYLTSDANWQRSGLPLSDLGEWLFKYGRQNRIDPAFGVAMAGHATGRGTNIVSNNLFRIPSNGGGLESFSSVEQSVQRFYRLMSDHYVSRGQDTPQEILCIDNSGFNSHCYVDTDRQRWLTGVTYFRQAVRAS